MLPVSLVSTVKNAAGEIDEFLASIEAQSRAPDEVVIVDGGSTDGTLDILRGAKRVRLIEEPGANIARGRNVAIQAAAHDVIAVSDADCVLDDAWLAGLTRAIGRGADVAMGAYRPIVNGFFDAVAASVAVPDLDELRPERFLPSSRSVAFSRSAYRAVGGYPEWLAIGEDMYVNLQWRRLGVRMDLVPDAIVQWRVRTSLREHVRQYASYARGDAVAGMHRRRHAVRFGVYGGATLALLSGHRKALAAAAAGGAVYAARPIRRAWRLRAGHRAEQAAAVLAVPAMMALTDLAKMAGYASGLFAGGAPPVDAKT